MQPEAMMQMLKSLKLHGMAQALGELAAQDSPAYKAASLVLAGLLKAEIAEREVRSLAYQMKVARFPAYRDMGGFDFSCSDADEALVRQLYQCDFIDSAHNIVLVGGPGTGKIIWRRPSVCRRSNIIAAVCVSSPPSNWSTHSNRRSWAASPGSLQHGSCMPTSWCWTSSATCRSARPAGRCCSICSASSTSAPASSSPPT